jgi:hypothetical protein
MTIVKDILKHMPGVAKPQAKFLNTFFAAILALRGRVNVRNLSRYCDYSERTISRQLRREFDFVYFNSQAMKSAIIPTSTLIAVQDASFIPKCGKHTYGLDRFFNGCAGRPERGLEISALAVVDVSANCAYTLAVSQTPPGLAHSPQQKELTRVDNYLAQVRENRLMLPAQISYLVVDGFYAKLKYVDGVRDLNLHLITKLRCDANLRYLFCGQQKKRGRPRRYDGKVNFQNLSRFDSVGLVEGEDHRDLYTAVVNHVSLKRDLRVVIVINRADPKKIRYAVLAATDTELDALEIYRLYRARFQIEFLFRDAKQFTGLADCQSRNQQALHFHYNASLTTLNLARIETVKAHSGTDRVVFSMSSWKQQAFNEQMLEMIIDKLALDHSFVKNHPCYDELRTYGSIAA